jgi:hypothetical protein
VSERYYQNSNNYPYVMSSIVERVLVYFAETLYPDETITNARKKIILANFEDDAASIRKSIDRFKTSNGSFPCTFYNISDDEPIMERSNLQKNGNFYSELVGAYVRYIPMIISIPMVTYLTTPFDFWRVMTLFASDEADMTRLDVPITINDILCSFVIDLEFTTERGSLAWDIEQQFGVGKLYPVIHSVSVKGAYITIDTMRVDGSSPIEPGKIVYHVEDIILKLSELQQNREVLIEEKHSPDTPEVSSSLPLNEATGVALDSNIVLTFNVAMNENSVISNIDIVPYFDHDLSFDTASKVLTINPRSNLTASTQYNILININAKSGDLQNLESEYSLVFTTGTV